MSIITRTFKDFFKRTGGGADEINATRKLHLETVITQDVGRGSKSDIDDKTLGPIIYNLQNLGEDEKNTRTFVQDEDEMINVIKATFPVGCVWIPSQTKWGIPVTSTEWMGGFDDRRGGDGGRLAVGNGATCATGAMYVDKVIPPGFKVYRTYVYGSNVLGAGNESTFKTYVGNIAMNSNVAAGASSNAAANFGAYQNMDPAVNLNGTGDKVVRIELDFSRGDVVYGGLITLTQI